MALSALPTHTEPLSEPARVTLTVHVTAEADRIPELTAGLVNALNALGRDELAVTVDGPVAPVLPLPARKTAPLRVQADARRVLWRDREVVLTRLEFDLLLYLATHPNRVHRRRALMTQVWRTTYVSERTVDVHVRRLRGKIGGGEQLIRTVRGVGYQLADPAVVAVERG
ncbi:winged helix-turn-helix domain-containing protein [Actinokineospora terrae]|uniref:Transcriptional regulatory protein, C terminal n=1 Tax=Actinokineospora terrae TaxID=155974 RepID=A0A1H9WT26_9PSEU|nr:winged helix-turn-helix domain-containing protein [Actinokineospora terrae]SES37090.1 Transcriptional regulatory protein, C terminal [Actinokineospora terrae]